MSRFETQSVVALPTTMLAVLPSLCTINILWSRGGLHEAWLLKPATCNGNHLSFKASTLLIGESTVVMEMDSFCSQPQVAI